MEDRPGTSSGSTSSPSKAKPSSPAPKFTANKGIAGQAFQSKLSDHNISKNTPLCWRNHDKQLPKSVTSSFTSKTFVNSRLAQDIGQLSLGSGSPNQANCSEPYISKNAKKKIARREAEVPENVCVSFQMDNPQIRDYFMNQVGPLYSGSSVQYLENLAHHPQFQYQREPHSAPVLTLTNHVQAQPPTFTPPPSNFDQQNFFFPNHQYQQNFSHVINSNQAMAGNDIQRKLHLIHNQFIRNNAIQVKHQQSIDDQHNAQYLKNVQQHPLFQSIQTQGRQPQAVHPTAENQKSKKKRPRRTKNKHQYEEYLSLDEVEEGLMNKMLLQGVLRINPKNYTHAYITTSREDQDILIDGIKKRNRALEGDVVVVQLVENDKPKNGNRKNLDKDGQRIKIDKDAESSDENEDERTDKDTTLEDRDITLDTTMKDEEIGEEAKNYRKGKIVFIKQKVHPRTCIGNLKLMPDKNHTRALFIPRDYRVPRLNVLCTSWPDNFHKKADEYENVLFLAKIVDWKDIRFAMGTIMRNVGQAGDVHTETMAILSELCLDITPYGPDMKSLFPGPDYIIPDEEVAKREDCREMCIFSIDPATCRDVDDALSCRKLENGNYEIGVHISDVSYYLKEDTKLDEKVSERATTIYLVERAYHMLPEELCILCSLFSGVDKLAFSVFWEITEDAQVLGHRFARTVIHSCAQLAYEHAQSVLEDHEPNELPQIYNGFKFDDIRDVIKTLGKLSAIFRQRRFEGGALRIDQPKLGFTLSPKSGLPESFHIFQSRPSHQLIEEFMLLANMTVAERLYKDHPSLAFLRNHPEPSKFQLNDLAKQLKAIDIEINTETAGSLFKSLYPYIGPDCGNQQRAIVLSMMCTKPLARALYFCVHGRDEEDFRHYALNVPYYTHFTSPIRRYADIMVHRLLSASLQYTAMPTWDVSKVQYIASNCNAQKYNAKLAGERSTQLYTLKYIEMNSPVQTEAVVVDVKEKYIDIIVIAMGLNRRIYMDQIKDVKTKYHRSSTGNKLSKLDVVWPASGAVPETSVQLALFSVVQIEMVKGSDILKIETRLLRPL